MFLMSPGLAGGFLPLSHLGSPNKYALSTYSVPSSVEARKKTGKILALKVPSPHSPGEDGGGRGEQIKQISSKLGDRDK